MINSASFNLFLTNVNARVGQIFSTLNPDLITSQIAEDFDGGEAETLLLGWTGKLPKARVWTGARVVVEPAPESYSVNYIPYELTLGIDQFRWEDSGAGSGIYFRMLEDQAKQLARQVDYWNQQLIEGTGPFTATSGAGNRQFGYDGISHWSTTHPIDLYSAAAGTYANDFTGGFTPSSGNMSGILVGGAFSPTAFGTSLEYIRGVPGQDGVPLGVRANLLMHPNALTTEVDLVLKSTYFSPPAWGTITGQVGAADNPLRKRGVEPLCNDLLTSATHWYLLSTNQGAKPFYWWPRAAPKITPMTAPNSQPVYQNHRMEFGGDGRGVAFWNYEFLSYRCG